MSHGIEAFSYLSRHILGVMVFVSVCISWTGAQRRSTPACRLESAQTGLSEARGARHLLVGCRLRIAPLSRSSSSQASTPVFSGLSIYIPENSRGSRGFVKPPTGRFLRGRGGPTRRRGWVPAAGIQGPAPCGVFWQQGRIPLHISVFFPPAFIAVYRWLIPCYFVSFDLQDFPV